MDMLNGLVLAAESTGASANQELVSAAQGAVDQITANINGILPIVLTLLGTVLGITIGIAVFRKLTNKAH